ncbi:MAG TPA: hypothetical protein VN634_03405 [Candidatus Limnocylindrales bacterium]|nr:hypothetical protein [Candidatus Limnocylindrales bacterium]
MAKDLLHEKERGEETNYIRRQEEKLIAKMRERARIDEIARALGDVLRVDDPELLRRIGELGLDQETGSAILAAPLVEVAWADGHVDEAEKAIVVAAAEERGLTPGTPAHDKLLEWLRERPSHAIVEAALQAMQIGFSLLPAAEREQNISSILATCRQVAEAAGGGLAKKLGISSGIAKAERTVLDEIAEKLHAPPRK